MSKMEKAFTAGYKAGLKKRASGGTLGEMHAVLMEMIDETEYLMSIYGEDQNALLQPNTYGLYGSYVSTYDGFFSPELTAERLSEDDDW